MNEVLDNGYLYTEKFLPKQIYNLEHSLLQSEYLCTKRIFIVT